MHVIYIYSTFAGYKFAMEEVRTEMKTFNVELKCDKCNKGFITATGNAVTQWHTQYEHKCNNPECDNHMWLTNQKYPYFEYKYIKKRKK